MSQTNKPTKQEQPMTDEIQIPPGYAMRANGDLVKLENLTDLEREEDALVNAIFPRAKALHDAMAEFKYVAMNMIEETIKRCVEEHGIKKFTKIKGNVQFVSVNGNYKIQRAVDDRIEHDSSIEVAMQKFAMYSEVLKEQAGPDAVKFIDIATTAKNGKYSTSRLIDLLNKDIDHPLYVGAKSALMQSLFISGSKAYLRFYIRNPRDDSWTAMPLQFSSIAATGPKSEAEEEQPDAA